MNGEHEQVVLKWTVPIDDQWHPIGGGPVALVDVQGRNGAVTVWTLEPHGGTQTTSAVRVFATGQPLPLRLQHLGSCQDGPFVWHLFRSLSAAETP